MWPVKKMFILDGYIIHTHTQSIYKMIFLFGLDFYVI